MLTQLRLAVPTFPLRRWLILVTFTTINLTLFVVASRMMPPDPNWLNAFYPAGRAVVEGRNSYQGTLFFNPPWLLLYLVPLSLPPSGLGKAVFAVVSFAVFIYVALRLGASRLSFAAFILSHPVLYSLVILNVDSLVLLGVLLPPRIGLFLVLLKPQIGGGIAFFRWSKSGEMARGEP